MRKTTTYVEEGEGRDKGKTFFLQEMPVFAAERWAIRAFMALARAGIEVPDNISSQGMRGIAVMSIRALGGMAPEEAFALLDEMMQCVQKYETPSNPATIRPLVETDIEEVRTLFNIRQKVLELHVGFSLAEPSNNTTTVSA